MILVPKALNYTRPWQTPDIFMFTGNTTITKTNKLVMGSGAAKDARDAHPGIDKELARLLQIDSNKGDGSLPFLLFYNLKALQADFHQLGPYEATLPANQQWLGWFRVKNQWQQPASLGNIAVASSQLAAIARKRPEFNFHLNYPGIGNGRLNEETVYPLINPLPDNVWIYKP